MSSARLAVVTWVLILGGLLSFAVGWTVRPAAGALGWLVVAASVVAVLTGVILIWVRSRILPPSGE